MKRFAICLFSLAAALLLVGFTLTTTGCGSGSTQIRFVHAADFQGNVDIVIDSKTVSTNVAYAASTSYMKVSSGSRTIEIRPTGTTSDLVNTKVTLAGGSNSTAVFELIGGGASLVVYTDDNSAPPSGQIKLRAIHAAQFPGNLDFYVIAPGAGISGASPTIANVTYSSATSYLTKPAGSYQIIATPAGNQSFFFLDTGASTPLNLTSGQIRTIVALDPLNAPSFIMLSDLH